MLWVGWCSSVILLTTIVYQVRQHQKASGNGGVSSLLYVGQLLASVGFVVYSLGVGNWVFVVTNSLLVAAAICGIWIHRKKDEDEMERAGLHN